jgi:glycosyltransferase involved in cell wall biosynthesis
MPRTNADGASVLFLARLAKKKRLDLLLQAFADERVRNAQLHLTVAGPVSADLEFEPVRRAEALDLTDSVSFVGQVDATQRAELMSSAAIYVLPSDDESFGMSVAEAMAAGCAVVTSPYVGVAQDAAGADAGVIASQDSTAIADAILALSSHPDRCAEMGSRAREYVRVNLTWDSIARNLSGIYAHTLSAQGRRND